MIKANFNKKYVHDFLLENHIDFIKEYIELSQKIDFSYAAVWELKENYLTLLYDHTKLGVLSEKRYAFYNEGPGWRIIFDGTPISPLTTKGFKYIHFLVSNKHEIFTIDKLVDLDEENTDTRHKKSRFDPKINSSKLGKTPLLDNKYIHDLKDKIKRLRKDIDEADRTEDWERKEKKEEELEKIVDYFEKNVRYVGGTKKLRCFSDASIKNQRRIAKNIERSLNEIKKWNEDAYRHFHDALAPIDSYIQSYFPLIDEDIDWHTE